MKLAEMLKEISETKSQELYEKFCKKVRDHSDRELLWGCAKQARIGKTRLCFGRSPIIPKNLRNEGFFVSQEGSGFYLNWA